MGFELAFFSQKDISEQLHHAGLSSILFTNPQVSEGSFITRGQQFVEKLADQEWLRGWIKTLLIDAVPSQIEMIDAAVAQFGPALIVTDPMIYASAIVAEQHAIPWVGVSSSLNPITPSHWQCELSQTLALFETERVLLCERFSIKPRFKVSDLISPWLNIVFSTEAYMPRKVCGNDFSYYVGDCLPLDRRGDETHFPFESLKEDTQKIYMSMGSQIYYYPQLFLAIAEAFSDSNIQLIFSINELYNTPFRQELPKNVIAVPYAPQLQILKKVNLMITHGGANSVMESLCHGIPLAIFPICNDQFFQAKFVVRAGVGIALNPNQIHPKTYREQLLPLLDVQSPVRQRAREMSASFQQYGGSKEAGRLIEQLYKTRKPMKPV